MNKIKFKGVSMKLLGVVDLKGKQLNIQAVDKESKLRDLASFEAPAKVVSTFPKLNTAVCDNQTKKIAQLASKHKGVHFVSITMDSPEVIAKWCLVHDLDNVTILSDKEHKQFSEMTNLFIPKLNMLARGLIILDGNNNVLESFYKPEITETPMFDELETHLHQLLAK